MNIFRFLSITILSLVAVASFAVAADEVDNEALIDEIIQKARALRGSEADLKKVKSLAFKGSMLYGTGETGSIELIYKKPYYHHLSSVVGTELEVSALDDSEAWLKSAHAATPDNWSLLILEADQVFNMRAKVGETLNFFARPTTRGSEVTYEGVEEIDGRSCHALLYYYGSGIWNLHYFDRETGDLVKIVNNKGIEFFEKGETIVDGVRFPKKLISVFYTERGRGTMEMSYTSVRVNEEYDKDLFAMPSVTE